MEIGFPLKCCHLVQCCFLSDVTNDAEEELVEIGDDVNLELFTFVTDW